MPEVSQSAAFNNQLVTIESNIPAWNNVPAQTQSLMLAVSEWGSPLAAPEHTFLLVHGLTANRVWWQVIAEGLVQLSTAPIRLIIADMRGRGDSDKPANGPYHVAANAADMLGLLNALGVREPVNYVGHSLGAHIGTIFASRYPERVRRLTLIDGGSRLSEDAGKAIAPAVSRLGQVYPDYDSYIAPLKQARIFPEWTEAVDRAYRYDCQEVEGGVMSKVSKTAIHSEIANVGLYYKTSVSLYPQIKVPTLIIRAPTPVGDIANPFLLPEHIQAMTSGIGGGAKVIEVPGANHYTVLIEPTLEMLQGILD